MLIGKKGLEERKPQNGANALESHPFCPICKSTRIWKDGKRKTSSEKIQRFLCRDCGNRFSEPNNLTDDKENTIRRVCDTENRSINLTVATETRATGDISELDSILEQYQDYLQRKWLEPETMLSKIKRLTTIYNYGLDIYNPDEVAIHLAKKKCSSGYKENLIFAYDDFVNMMGWEWNRPKVNEVKKPIRVPLETDIDQLIAGCTHTKAAFLQLLKETGMRPSTAYDRKWEDIDFRTKQIYITPKKKGNPRTLPISDKLIEMIKLLDKENEYLFKTTILKHFSDGFRKQRKRIAKKLGNPNIMKINFKSFRHFYATKLYGDYKDLMLVKYALGHKTTKYTEVYTHIVNFPEQDTFIVKAVTTAEEAIPLIEHGYVFDSTTPDGFNIYKKRK